MALDPATLSATHVSTALSCFRSQPHNEALRTDFLNKLCTFVHQCGPQVHFLHLHPDFSVEAMLVLSLTKSNHIVEQFQLVLSQQLSHCLECIGVYYDSRSIFFSKYSSIYHKEDMDDFIHRLYKWDLTRHASVLSKFLVALEGCQTDPIAEKNVRKGSLIIIYEILNYPQTLRLESIDRSFTTLLIAVQQKSRLKLRDSIFPGIILFCVHKYPAVREWAQGCISRAGISIQESSISVLSSVLLSIVYHIRHIHNVPETISDPNPGWNISENEHELWKGFMCIFSLIKQECIPMFLDRIIPDAEQLICAIFLKENTNDFWLKLELFNVVIRFTDCKQLRSSAFSIEARATIIRNVTLSLSADETFFPLLVNSEANALELVEYRAHLFCGWMLRFILLLYSGAETDQKLDQHDWLAPCLSPILTLSRRWVPPARKILQAQMLKLLESQALSLALKKEILVHLIHEKNSYVETHLLTLVSEIVHEDVQEILIQEKSTASSQACFRIHDSLWAGLRSFQFGPASLTKLIALIIPLAFTSSICLGATLIFKPTPTVDGTSSLVYVTLTIRYWLQCSVANNAVPGLAMDFRLTLLIFNDTETQASAKSIFESSVPGNDMPSAVSALLSNDADVFFSSLFSCLSTFKKSCHTPTDCIVSSNFVIDLLCVTIVHALGPDDDSLYTNSASHSRPARLSDQSLNFWLHSYLTAFALLSAALRWAKYARFSSQEIKQLVVRTVRLMQTLFRYHAIVLPSNIKQDLLGDWCEECAQALLPWTRTTDLELRNTAISLLIDTLVLSTSIATLFDRKLFQRINSLGMVTSHMSESQSMSFTLWISQQEHLYLKEHSLSQPLAPSNCAPSSTVEAPLVSDTNVGSSIPITPHKPGVIEGKVDPSEILIFNISSDDEDHHSNLGTSSEEEGGGFDLSEIELIDPIDPRPKAPSNQLLSSTKNTHYAPTSLAPLPKRTDVLHPSTVKHPHTGTPLILTRRTFPVPRTALAKAGGRKSSSSGKLSKLQQLRAEAMLHCRRSNIMRPIISSRPSKTITTTEIRPAVHISKADDDEPRERRQIKTIDLPNVRPGSARIGRLILPPTTTEVAVKPLRALNDLYRHVLSWDMLLDHSKLPPSLEKTKFINVPDLFQSPLDYVNCFEPLLLLECWQQFVQARVEVKAHDALVLIIHALVMVDDMHDITFLVQATDIKLQLWSENIILALSEPNSKVAVLGRIRNISYKGSDAHVVCQTFLGNRMNIITQLKPKSKWDAVQVFSLTTALREYKTLLAITSFPLSQTVLRPPKTKPIDLNSIKIDEYQRQLKVNLPQARAISASVECKSGFVLIQGPPGTGKTKTILGLIGAMHRTSTAISLPKNGDGPSDALRASLSVPRTHQNGPSMSKGRLLCCAPSNAAIDEIARRLITGILDLKGNIYKPNIVRVGTSAIHADIKSVTLDYLVEERLKTNSAYKRADSKVLTAGETRSEIFAEMSLLKSERDNLWALEEKNTDDSTKRIREISTRLSVLYKLLDDEASSKTDGGAELERVRRSVRAKILAEADVVLATLSGAGHDQFSESVGCEFHMVIIDEACQAVELSCLIPLCYGAKKCIMVGDPNQLPPTILSQQAQDNLYDQSLFQRLMKSCKESRYLLSIQYRMHPHISNFPSMKFYDSELKDAPGLAATCAAPWHVHSLFRPYQLLDSHIGKEQSGSGNSLFNAEEADLCVALVKKICSTYGDINFASRIGIIAFYKLQVKKLKSLFITRFGRGILEVIDINTVDGFQGQEKDIILLSCVRANKDRGVGFISDVRRMNVALTRARHTLIIIGHLQTLKTNEVWGSLVENAKSRGLTLKLTARNIRVPGTAIFPNLLAGRDGQVKFKKSSVAQTTGSAPNGKIEGLLPLGPPVGNGVDNAINKEDGPRRRPEMHSLGPNYHQSNKNAIAGANPVNSDKLNDNRKRLRQE
ncbi:hypothetical protein BASA50_007851 [Batrachochytrium salamandrivorans]|uniref:AAA+ ATPase domain-containing protein n=1 Tax=Batrachochytrium salamandrivorans TaxID=1357716 RepID=A0ABQ8F5V7_9FUNG|nr:hypothetical protein BASA50_007851 [Batrachochytrium salamandrivorans]